MAGVDRVLIFVPILCQRSSCPVRKYVHISENSEIGSKNIFCLTIIIVSSSDNLFFILLCIKITMCQHIIHDALCHHASCYVIITNCMIHMCCVGKGFKFVWTRGYHNSSCFQFHDYSTIGAKGHFRQGSKEQGLMKSSIPIGQELEIGPKAFRQGSRTKTNQIVM
jgi:hypothetical protein